MKILTFVKHTVGLTTSLGTGIIVGNVVRAFLPPEQKILAKVATYTATAVLGGMLGDAAAKYTDGVFDNVANTITATKDELDALREGEM